MIIYVIIQRRSAAPLADIHRGVRTTKQVGMKPLHLLACPWQTIRVYTFTRWAWSAEYAATFSPLSAFD